MLFCTYRTTAVQVIPCLCCKIVLIYYASTMFTYFPTIDTIESGEGVLRGMRNAEFRKRVIWEIVWAEKDCGIRCTLQTKRNFAENVTKILQPRLQRLLTLYWSYLVLDTWYLIVDGTRQLIGFWRSYRANFVQSLLETVHWRARWQHVLAVPLGDWRNTCLLGL